MIYAICLAAVLIAGSALAAGEPPPRVFLLDSAALVSVKTRVAAGDESLAPALKALLKDADRALGQGPFSVMDKTAVPPSGDKHDYMSMAPYWWPDPSKPDGKPYIRKDGVRNPEGENLDSGRMSKMQSAVNTLALAFYLTGEERYAEHAVKLLRAWFLDRETRMNPHLEYGQAVPGSNQGRGLGIIETQGYGMLVDSISLLKGSEALRPADLLRLKAWFRDYLRWLRESDHGRYEENYHNNHATKYDVQAAGIALFVGDYATAKEILGRSAARRIDTQIEPDGRQPKELARTKALSYSLANLHGMFDIARLAEHVGLDLWRHESADGRSIRKALDWLLPYATGEKEWDHQQISSVSDGSWVSLLRRAALKYGHQPYEDALRKLNGVDLPAHRAQLLHPR